MEMYDYSKERYLICSMVLVTILSTNTMANASYNFNRNSKQQTNINSKSIKLINLEKTPDQIARSCEATVISSIEKNKFMKK